MSNRLALWLFALIAAVVLLDLAYLGWDLHIIAMKGVAEAVRTLAIWR